MKLFRIFNSYTDALREVPCYVRAFSRLVGLPKSVASRYEEAIRCQKKDRQSVVLTCMFNDFLDEVDDTALASYILVLNYSEHFNRFEFSITAPDEL